MLLDFVGDRELSLPREASSSTPALVAAAGRGAAGRRRRASSRRHAQGTIYDDHTPFLRRRRPGDRPHRLRLPPAADSAATTLVDKLSARSLDAVGETVLRAGARAGLGAGPRTLQAAWPQRPREAPARGAARLLRGRRPRRADRRARARALRRAGLRAQGDRPQQARRRAAARARRDLRRGARRPIPEGAVTVFSAHGVVARASTPTPSARGLRTIDATCPLVTKVHARR